MVHGPGRRSLAEGRYQRIGKRHDGTRRAIVLLQNQHLGASEGIRKLDKQSRVGAAKTIDALKGIANDRQVVVAAT